MRCFRIAYPLLLYRTYGLLGNPRRWSRSLHRPAPGGFDTEIGTEWQKGTQGYEKLATCRAKPAHGINLDPPLHLLRVMYLFSTKPIDSGPESCSTHPAAAPSQGRMLVSATFLKHASTV
jgi:hypothetical protein